VSGQELGILPVRNTVLFPEVTVPILVGREKSRKLIEAVAGRDEPLIGVVAQRVPEQDDPAVHELYAVGTVGRLLKVTRVNDNNLQLIIQGEKRFRIGETVSTDPYLVVRVETIEEEAREEVEIEALARSVKALAVSLIDLRGDLPGELASMVQARGPWASPT
jgi:ATP-dependent Lon protease